MKRIERPSCSLKGGDAHHQTEEERNRVEQECGKVGACCRSESEHKKMGKKDCEERREGRKVQQIGDGAGSGGVFSLTPIYLHMSLNSAPL